MDGARAWVRDQFGEVLELVARRAPEVDRTAEFPEDVLRAYQEAGLMAAQVPPELGGLGLSHLQFAAVVEEVARYSGALSLLLIVQAVGLLPLLLRPEFPRRDEVLTRVIRSGALVGFALTEPPSGSDAYNMRTEVVPGDGGHRLTGVKYLITNAGKAHAYVVFATFREPGLKHVAAYLVDADREGVRVGPANRLLGMRGIPTASIYLDNVAVDDFDRVGGKNEGYVLAMETLNISRPWIGAQAVGLARGALDAAVQFACQRKVMGEPLIDKQAFRFSLAEVVARIEAASALVERTSRMIDAGREDYTAQSAMCKLVATDTAMWACERALQMLGGPGCIAGNRAERAFRDVKITQIYEGTNEVQKMLVARELVRAARARQPAEAGTAPELLT